MAVDTRLQLVVALIAFVSWAAYSWLAWRPPAKAFIIIGIAAGMVSLSWIAANGPVDVLGQRIDTATQATINRAFVAATGLAFAIRAATRRWESRHDRDDRET